MAFDIAITTGSTTPIYKQITDQARLAAATGKLGVSDQLPSIRALAEQLVINANTVARSYADLAREGLIEARPGRGVFVIHKRKVFTREEGRRAGAPGGWTDRGGDGDGFLPRGIAPGHREKAGPVEGSETRRPDP